MIRALGSRMAVLSLLLLGGLWSAVGASNMAVVTCGSVVKLLNIRHNVRLHSHDVRYGSDASPLCLAFVSCLQVVGSSQ